MLPNELRQYKKQWVDYLTKKGTERTKEIVLAHLFGNKPILCLKTTISYNSIGTPFRGDPKM